MSLLQPGTAWSGRKASQLSLSASSWSVHAVRSSSTTSSPTNCSTPELREVLRRAGMKSGVVAPMSWQDRMLGSIGIAGRQPDAFGPRDAQFLVSVATQVTAIVRMAKLVDDLRGTTARLADAQEETVMLLAAAAEAHEAGLQPSLPRRTVACGDARRRARLRRGRR